MITTNKSIIKTNSPNLLQLSGTDGTFYGMTVKFDSDAGTVNYNGTLVHSSGAYNFVLGNFNPMPSGTYTLCAYNKQAGASVYAINVSTGKVIADIVYTATGNLSKSFTLDADTNISIRMYCVTNTTFNNYTAKVMVVSGDVTASILPFEPYYNRKTIYKRYLKTDNLCLINDWHSSIVGLIITPNATDPNTVTISGTSTRGALAIQESELFRDSWIGKTITFSQSKKFTAWNDPAATFWQIWRDGAVYKITPTSSQTVTFEEGHTWSIRIWCGVPGEKNYTISFWANESAVAKPFQPYSVVTYKKHIVERT